MTTIFCAECRAGDHEHNEIAVYLVSHPNPDHPGLRVRKWVCAEHYDMLCDDYGKDVRMEQYSAFKSQDA